MYVENVYSDVQLKGIRSS